jgi:hypothetical protein
MQSRMRYLLPLILAALFPLSSLAEASPPQNAAPTHWALFSGKKSKKPKKEKKAPKSKRTHGAKKQRSAKSGH